MNEKAAKYEVSIDAFEGPLDLLLHLMKQSKISIYEVKISEITQQYLDYIKAMETLELEIASEYLVMAATLIEIKAKSLLPKQKVEIESDYEEDSEEALIQRLIEYKRYKEAAQLFKELEEERGQFYTKPPIDFTDYLEEEVRLPQNGDVNRLVQAFEKIMRRNKMSKPVNTRIVATPLSVEGRMEELSRSLKYKKRIPFHTLFTEFDREYIIITFLALLELVKSGEIKLIQTSYQEECLIYSLVGDEVDETVAFI